MRSPCLHKGSSAKGSAPCVPPRAIWRSPGSGLAEVGAHRARVAPHGRPALLELQGQIAEAQVLDQLAAVTVVVAQSAIGLSTRRRLAAEAPVAAGGGIGVRNVRFVTVADLARELGESALAAKGRVPLTEAALVGVLRQTLSERSSGVFTEVGE